MTTMHHSPFTAWSPCHWAVGWLILSLGSSLGCGPGDPGLQQREVAERLITEDPASFIQRTKLLAKSPVKTWSFRRAEDLESWHQEGFNQRFALGRKGLILHSKQRRPRLIRLVDWDAATIDSLDLKVPGFARGLARLYWAREGEELTEERSLAGRLVHGVTPLPLVFDVVFHSEWRGRIKRIAIELFQPDNEPFRVRTISVNSYQPIAGEVAAAVARSWKIDLDHEVRNGRLALPEAPITRRLKVPSKAVLEVGFGTNTGARQPVVFAAFLDTDDGETTTLFETLVDPDQPPRAGQWHDRKIDLGAHAGEDITLRLATRAPSGDYDLVHGLAFWSNPEILRQAAGPAKPNVILISIDTLRADHLSLHGYPRRTTPNLDRWAARRAAVFDQTVAASPWTIPSHVSIFSGLDALRHGVNHPTSVPGRLRLMAEMLRDAGYGTLAITGGGFMQPQRGFAQGFDRYRYWPKLRSEEELDRGVDRALDWVGSFADRPFFLFLHTFEVHYPFRRRQPFYADLVEEPAVASPDIHVGLNVVPTEAEEGFILSKEFFWKKQKKVLARHPVTDAEMREIIDRYDSGIAYADDRLERLLTRLEEPEVARRTVVIVTSDHGEALGEKGLAGHAYLYDFNLLVPLLIALPGGEGGRRVGTQVRSVDLLPTVLELAGVAAPPDLDGASLVPLLSGDDVSHPREAWSYAAFSNRGVSLRFDNRLKYHYNNTAWDPLRGQGQLYDLQQDPAEDHDLAADSRQAEAFQQRAKERIAQETAALEVRFSNASDRAYRGLIRGIGIHPTTVKTSQLPDGALIWERVGAAEFLVRPGESYQLLLERPTGSPLLAFKGAFESPRDDGDAFAEKVPEADFGGWRMIHHQGGWQSGPGDPPAQPATGVVVRWHGYDGESEATEEAIADPGLVEQLRALGYVNN